MGKKKAGKTVAQTKCHGVSWHIAPVRPVSGRLPVFGIRGISGDIPEETIEIDQISDIGS